MKDVVVDLETLDISTGFPVIVAIGAVQCDLPFGKIGETFYRIIKIDDQIRKGFSIDGDTLSWWMRQSDQARELFSATGAIYPDQLCDDFNTWLLNIANPELIRLWGNGSGFDCTILRNFYEKLDFKFPIPFWQDRDMRTVLGFYPKSLQEKWKNSNFRSGTYHNALDDAKHQVNYISHILQELGVKELW